MTQNGNGSTNPPNGNAKPKPNAASQPMGLAVLIGVPWLMFAMVNTLFGTAYHHYAALVWLVVLAWVMMSIIFLVLDARKRMGGNWFRFLAVLCLLAILNGIIFGSYNYWTHLFPYWSYDEGAVYSNVLPTTPAAALSDARKILFAAQSRVDTSRALGFKVGDIYCVAPILDNTQMSRVEFWAAGTNCCPARGDFSCDDTWNPSSKSGVVILGALDSGPSEGRMGFGMRMMGNAKENYMRAVKTAEAAYGLTSSEAPLLVRWVRDPQAIQDDYWRSGVGFMVATLCIYLLLSIIAGAILQMWSKRTAASEGAQGVNG
jgi:hypothetical protein